MSPLISRRTLVALGAGAALAPRLPGLAGPARAATHSAEALAAATAYSRAIGEIEVTALLDGYLPLGREVLVEVEDATVTEALTAAFLDPDQPVATGVTAHLLRAGGQLILIDAGAGGAFGPTAGRLDAGLASIGVAPEDIGLVLVTHMHGDHIGGMLADCAALFPEAEIRIAEADLAFWTDEANESQAPEPARPGFALSRAVVEAYGERVAPFSGETEVAPGVTSLALPGHTPGHTGFIIASGDETLLLWADIVHIAAVQFRHPEASLVFDTDPGQAAETRRMALDMVATDRMLIAGAHLPYPTFGHVAARDGAYDWAPETWQYR